MRRLGYVGMVFVLMGALILGGCGGGGTAATGDEVKVSMKDMAYAPKQLNIKPGTKVVWVNDDVLDHSVAEGAPGSKSDFKSGDFRPGSDYSHTFGKAGTYEIYCTTPGHYEAGMKMTVVVGE